MPGCKISRCEFISGVGALFFAETCHAETAPRLKVGLFSDTHVNDDPSSCERTRLALETFKRERVDAIAHLGDLANYHLPKAFRNYRNTVDAVFPASSGRPRFLYAWGNHDSIDYVRRDNPKDRQMDRHAAFEVMKEILGIDHGLDFETEINGYTFLCVPETITDVCNLKEFDRRISEACKRHPDKPVFMMHHPPPYGTCDNSLKNVTKATYQIFCRYPQLVVLSGHKHTSVMNERSIWQGAFTEVQTSCLYNWISNWDSVEQGSKVQVRPGWGVMVMDVYGDRLEFRRFDVRQPEEYNPAGRWCVPLPFSPASAPYAAARRKAEEKAGVFAAKAKVEVNPDKRFKWLTIRIPTVENVSDVRSYRVLAERKTDDGMEEVLRENAIGDFDEMPSARKGHVDMRIEAKPFTPGETYRFTVTPEGFFGRQGASLSCEWRANVVN